MDTYKHRIKTANDLLHEDFLQVMPNGCWEWKGRKDPYGYGVFVRSGKQVRVTRTILEHVTGIKLGSLHALHRCDNPPCFNPDHLFAGTHAQNMQDKSRKGRCGLRKPGGKRMGKVSNSGVPGVSWIKDRNKWRVYKRHGKKQFAFGEFDSVDDAVSRKREVDLMDLRTYAGRRIK